MAFAIGGFFDGSDFNIGAENYQDYNTAWESPQNPGDFNGTVAVDATAPEPASMVLFGTGMLGLSIKMRRRLFA